MHALSPGERGCAALCMAGWVPAFAGMTGAGWVGGVGPRLRGGDERGAGGTSGGFRLSPE